MDEDEAFERAIALSLREATTKPPVTAPIIIDSDDEDEDENGDAQFQAELQQALEASKSEFISASQNPNSHSNHSSQLQPESVASTSESSSFLSTRAQMERERVERQKRLRREAGLDDDDVEQPPAKRHHVSSSSAARSTNSYLASASRATIPSTSVVLPTIDRIFWDGEMRQTANMHAEPRRDGKPTFRLTEVLGKKSDISFAILSSYSLDIAWIYQFFDRAVPVIMVAQPGPSGDATVHNVLPNWIKTTPFLAGGRGCMHMKFMLLFYKSDRRVRVVVSTANLVDFDWRDIENTVWLQDIPIRSQPIPHDPEAHDFAAMFQRVLKGVNVRPALSIHRQTHPTIPLQSIDDLRTRWDWSKVKVQLIPSIAGKHEGWPKVILTGHTRLMKAVRDIGMRISKGQTKGKEVVLECQGSSIGQYTTQWMNAFYHSARGESAEDWLDHSKASRAKLSYPPMKIIYPSLKTVQGSALGEKGGGTIFCRRDQWKAPNFPRHMFHDSESKGGRVLMHSKMIIATIQNMSSSSKGKSTQTQLSFDSGSETEDEDEDDDVVEIVEKTVGWAYVGSHNFTPSAWGNLSGSSFNPILNIPNYELGILFPLKEEADVNRVACFERPARKYAASDLPWMQEESGVMQGG